AAQYEWMAAENRRRIGGLLPITAQPSVQPSRPVARTQAADYRHAVVQVIGSAGAGTGTVIDNQGTVLTCHHVIEGSSPSFQIVWLSGARASGQVVATDPKIDVAIIKTAPSSVFIPLASESEWPRQGETVELI